jgi:HK97 family phage major capsid protein
MSLLEKVREERAKINAPAEALIAAAEGENRDLTTDEWEIITAAKTGGAVLDERIADLELIESRKAKPVIGGAVIRREERTYTRAKNVAGETSFFADAFQAQIGDFNARQRLERHLNEVRVENEFIPRETRAVATSGFAGLVVPQYLVDAAAVVLRNGRPTANICRHLPLPSQGMTLYIPRGTTGASAASQATENNAASNTDEVWANLSIPVVTIAGQQQMSRQSLERGMPGLDELIYLDLAGAYHAELDRQVLNGSGSSNQMTGIINTGSIGAATAFAAVPAAANFSLKVAGQVAGVSGAGAQVSPGYIVMAPRRWGWLNGLVDSSNRPIVIPTAQGPYNAILLNATGSSADGGEGSQVSTTLARVVGTLQGLPVIVDPNMPTNIGTNTEDIVLVGDFNQALLYEEGDGMPRMLRFEQTLGNQLTTTLAVYGYAAFSAGRYPTAFGKVGGVDSTATFGLVAPSF